MRKNDLRVLFQRVLELWEEVAEFAQPASVAVEPVEVRAQLQPPVLEVGAAEAVEVQLKVETLQQPALVVVVVVVAGTP